MVYVPEAKPISLPFSHKVAMTLFHDDDPQDFFNSIAHDVIQKFWQYGEDVSEFFYVTADPEKRAFRYRYISAEGRHIVDLLQTEGDGIVEAKFGDAYVIHDEKAGWLTPKTISWFKKNATENELANALRFVRKQAEQAVKYWLFRTEPE